MSIIEQIGTCPSCGRIVGADAGGDINKQIHDYTRCVPKILRTMRELTNQQSSAVLEALIRATTSHLTQITVWKKLAPILQEAGLVEPMPKFDDELIVSFNYMSREEKLAALDRAITIAQELGRRRRLDEAWEV